MSNTSVSEPSLQSGNDKNQEIAPALWNPTIVGALSTIFSPVFGSILILLNWQALGIKEKIRSALLWLIISIIMLVVIFYDWPVLLPVFIYLTYLIVWYLYLVKPQANYISEHWKQTYTRRSWPWQLLIPMVLGCTATFPLFLFRDFMGRGRVSFAVLFFELSQRFFDSLFLGVTLAGAIFTVLIAVIGFAVGKRFSKRKNTAIVLSAIFTMIMAVIICAISLYISVLPV